MFKHAVIVGIAVSIICGGTALAEGISTEKEAIMAAEDWLKLVDEGQYEESWEQASGYFKAVIKQEAWKDSIQPLRDSLGKVTERKLINHEFTMTMPGAPDGQYVVIQFETSFENKKDAVETITPMMDADGVYRVSGYYIK